MDRRKSSASMHKQFMEKAAREAREQSASPQYLKPDESVDMYLSNNSIDLIDANDQIELTDSLDLDLPDIKSNQIYPKPEAVNPKQCVASIHNSNNKSPNDSSWLWKPFLSNIFTRVIFFLLSLITWIFAFLLMYFHTCDLF